MPTRISTRMLLTIMVLLALGVLAILPACGVGATGRPLLEIHENEDFEEFVAGSDIFCLGCHSRGSIDQATRDYDGETGVSLHEPPADHVLGTCTSCHRPDDLPVMTCNQAGCHDYILPENWVASS
ncbi:MAG: cytochrome c3 family protein [Coriobacteriales bacterium]|nr:cytochrome c3 family protein [Coriobacteriales bacterium]